MNIEELTKDLGSLIEDLKKLVSEETNSFEDALKKRVDEAINDEAYISVDKKSDGATHVVMRGSTLSILFTLAGLEKAILEKLDTPRDLWDYVKSIVDTEGVNNG